jgi:hypothetical protein
MLGVHDYSIVLFGYENRATMPVHCGTGTFVKLRDRHYILTAHHCAAQLIKYEKIALPIRPQDPLIIQTSDPIYIGNRKEDEWGPDLAFIPINNVDVNNFKAFSRDKVFYDLGAYSSQILEEKPTIARNVWSLVGSPNLLTTVTDTDKVILLQLPLTAYKVRVGPTVSKNGFDYIDIRVPLDVQSAPSTFQGVSGGGLWRAELKQDIDGSVRVAGPRLLVGCAFYETGAKRKYRFIRCHGWYTIYQLGLSKLELAN